MWYTQWPSLPTTLAPASPACSRGQRLLPASYVVYICGILEQATQFTPAVCSSQSLSMHLFEWYTPAAAASAALAAADCCSGSAGMRPARAGPLSNIEKDTPARASWYTKYAGDLVYLGGILQLPPSQPLPPPYPAPAPPA